jgi:intracellular sulfur oxidation DsrE/DsrF family protein
MDKENKMKRNATSLVITLMVLIGYLLSSGIAYSAGVEALKGLESVKAVIDFRTGDPNKAVTYLTLIGDTLKDRNIQAVTKNPDFVVSFGGHSVKLLARDTKGYSPEEQKKIDEVKARISALAKEGVRFEYCSYAAQLFGVEPVDLPGLRIVDNGWVSLIGYQGKGYSLIPAY